MEIYAFQTHDVETKLQDIRCALYALNFAVNGLKNLDLIDSKELAGFEFAIEEADKRVTALIQSMRPICSDFHNKKLMILTCVEKNK